MECNMHIDENVYFDIFVITSMISESSNCNLYIKYFSNDRNEYGIGPLKSNKYKKIMKYNNKLRFQI